MILLLTSGRVDEKPTKKKKSRSWPLKKKKKTAVKVGACDNIFLAFRAMTGGETEWI